MQMTPGQAMAFCTNTYDSSNDDNPTLVSINSHFDLKFPGFKQRGDYALQITNDVCSINPSNTNNRPTHTEVLNKIHSITTSANFDEIVDVLEHVFQNGTSSYYPVSHNNLAFGSDFQDLIFWVSFQEEVNYPPPRYQGKKLAMSRFYEAALSKVSPSVITFAQVDSRTNNHRQGVPAAISVNGHKKPFYY